MPSFRPRLVPNSVMPFQRTVMRPKHIGVRYSATKSRGLFALELKCCQKGKLLCAKTMAGFVEEQYEARTILTPTPAKPLARLFPLLGSRYPILDPSHYTLFLSLEAVAPRIVVL